MRKFILLMTLGLTGCASMSSSAIRADLNRKLAAGRVDYVAQHRSELSDTVAQAIVDGRVLVGMTLEQALTAWAELGPPEAVNRTTTAGGVLDQYAFRRMRSMYNYEYAYFYVQNGRVTVVQAEPGR